MATTNNNTTGNEAKVFQLQSDAAGDWNMVVGQKIAPGPHIVTIQDEKGNEAQVMMYILDNGQVTQVASSESATPAAGLPQIVDRTTTVTPSFLLYAIAIMAVMIVILIINALRLNKKSKNGGNGNGSWLNYILLAVIALILIATLSMTMNFRIKDHWSWNNASGQQQIMEVSGRLINPLTKNGFSDVDLVSGNTSIRTNASGQFLFDNVTPAGVRLTHADLLRTFTLLPDGRKAKQAEDYFLDVNLYNTLVKVVDLEARGKSFDVYDLLAPRIKEKISADKYQAGAKTIFSPKNISDQQISLLETVLLDSYEAKAYGLKFNRVLKLKVAASGATADYYFVSDGQAGWQLIK